jgi:hypothetical protein
MEITHSMRSICAKSYGEETSPVWFGEQLAYSGEVKTCWYSDNADFYTLPYAAGELVYDGMEGAYELLSIKRNPDQDLSPTKDSGGSSSIIAYDVVWKVFVLLDEDDRRQVAEDEQGEHDYNRMRDDIDALTGCSMAELGAMYYPEEV